MKMIELAILYQSGETRREYFPMHKEEAADEETIGTALDEMLDLFSETDHFRIATDVDHRFFVKTSEVAHVDARIIEVDEKEAAE